MFRRKSGRTGRVARRAAVLAVVAGAAFAGVVSPANAETYTATCAPIPPGSDADGVHIQMLGVNLTQGYGVRVTLIMDDGMRRTELGQWAAEYGQPYWRQGGPSNLPGSSLMTPLVVSQTPGGMAGSVHGNPTMFKAWYFVEWYQIGGQPSGGYTHPVKAHDGGDWCHYP